MVLKRCPQCGTTTEDSFGFCTKCGREFPEENEEVINNKCPNCGFENIEGATMCVKCGTPLIFKETIFNLGNLEKNQESNPKIILQSEMSQKPSKNYNLIIILGYIFSILGGIIGLILALYLVTRKDSGAKRHGSVQLTILLFYAIMILLMYLNGDLNNVFETYNQIAQNYTQMFNRTN
ncbi:zinc ribbon domain-containing protein [Methanobrevibacter sp. OttesenSCG-928-K11]|nr:zinc ribbon domain-containing protein [Methanobrevibacter sp. OttesenSCG-928-K11]MDL2270175.1 zinc ribbon domain-containing protein [Methanobrevibacter sp. OttesenSCG-928-I08]